MKSSRRRIVSAKAPAAFLYATTVLLAAVALVATANAQVCGNGVVEGSEQCDDGNSIEGDCCSAACAFEAADARCLEDDLCYAATDARCDGLGACLPGPALFGCLGPGGLPIAHFKLRDVAPSGRDKIAFRKKTSNGFADLLAALGDPSEATGYALCVYRTIEFQPEPVSVLVSLPVAAGSSWTALSDGWRYRDPRADGSRRLEIRERKVEDFITSGYRLRYVAKGESLPLPGPVDASRYFALDDTSGIAAGIVNGIGFCAFAGARGSDSPFSGLEASKNTATLFVVHNLPVD